MFSIDQHRFINVVVKKIRYIVFQLPEILKEIASLVLNSDMPCFHPESVKFLKTKWDLVANQVEEEEEMAQVWETLKTGLRKKWPYVKEEHIFRLNLKEVMFYIDIMHAYSFESVCVLGFQN